LGVKQGIAQLQVPRPQVYNRANISRKRGQDMRVSTLRRYLGALGFDLEITAVAGNKRIVIRREHAHR
jgi:sulfur carrier protein ThiS